MKRRIKIRGERVQDVGYRLFLMQFAEQLGLRGFQARNVVDGVECLVEGDEEKVKDFLELTRTRFPEFASVREVIDEEYEGSVMSTEGFYRMLSLEQLVKIVNVGLSMLEKQDAMLGKQDTMLGKMDLMLEKQDAMIDEIRALRQDLKSWMDERLSRIEREIAEIKLRIGMH